MKIDYLKIIQVQLKMQATKLTAENQDVTTLIELNSDDESLPSEILALRLFTPVIEEWRRYGAIGGKWSGR